MALVRSKEEKKQLAKLENQTLAIKQLSKLESVSVFSSLYEMYQANTYHFVQYNVKEDKKSCFKLAFLFSKYPNIFLGKKRTEIQLDNESVSLSTNDWVKCKSLPTYEMDFTVEYYMSTVNFFPVMIFFRIKKSIENHEAKLKAYIDLLLGIPLLMDKTTQTMIQNIVPIEREVILQLTPAPEDSDDDSDDPMELSEQDVKTVPSNDLSDLENGSGMIILTAFLPVMTHKGTYISLLAAGMVVTCYFMETMAKQENGHNQTY